MFGLDLDWSRAFLQVDHHVGPVSHGALRLQPQHPPVVEIKVSPGNAVDYFPRPLVKLKKGEKEGEMGLCLPLSSLKQALHVGRPVGKESGPITVRGVDVASVIIDEGRQFPGEQKEVLRG